jgi:hydrogenase/urease accessory protein HupE
MTASASRRSTPFCAVLLALLTWLAATDRTAAHELGLTRVTVTFRDDGRVQADVLVDPESLLAKLEILAGQSPSTAVPLDQLPARITALQAVVQQRTRLVFDGVRETPTFLYIPGPPPPAPAAGAPPTASTATIRLIADVPRGARLFQINYGLVLGSYALTLVSASGHQVATVWLAGGQDSQAFDLRAGLVDPSALETARQYFVLGFEHILPKGLDHILFVLGLFLLSASWRALLLQVTMFTAAHSLTLGLSMYGVVSLPASIVEPLIALSITYVAIENLLTSELKPWRAALVFAFGLLHGLGFAGVLGELGLPRSQFLPALITFNLGVEAGQLTVIGLAFAAVGWWRRAQASSYRRWVVVPASLAIAIVGAWWTVTRVYG